MNQTQWCEVTLIFLYHMLRFICLRNVILKGLEHHREKSNSHSLYWDNGGKYHTKSKYLFAYIQSGLSQELLFGEVTLWNLWKKKCCNSVVLFQVWSWTAKLTACVMIVEVKLRIVLFESDITESIFWLHDSSLLLQMLYVCDTITFILQALLGATKRHCL